MTAVTVISDSGATETDAHLDGARVWVSPQAVDAALGWEVKPEGLCRGELCVPAATALRPDETGRIDLVAVAEALERPTLLDAEARSIVLGASLTDRRGALRDKLLPQIALPDLDGQLHQSDEWLGSKVLLVAFASW